MVAGGVLVGAAGVGWRELAAGGGLIWGCRLGDECWFGTARAPVSMKSHGARKLQQKIACRVSGVDGVM